MKSLVLTFLLIFSFSTPSFAASTVDQVSKAYQAFVATIDASEVDMDNYYSLANLYYAIEDKNIQSIREANLDLYLTMTITLDHNQKTLYDQMDTLIQSL
ncbi:MAG: hypothetical protein KDD33_12875 [Bdellovibrionales bacterium]|nr:hypothetical protein [Bdellovibrionales bacterium]